MKNRRIIGIVFSILAISICYNVICRIEFSMQLESNFSLEYWMQFTPLVIGLTMLVSGILLIFGHPKTNFMLSLFGFDVMEEIIFDYMGYTNTNLVSIEVIGLLVFALAALWMAFYNPFNLKSLSTKEVVIGLVFGALLSLFPYRF